MEYHKGLMKKSLAENLRSLMVRHLFEKITIKQICDETGVIRATFYNYFDDKYDCLNWIVYHDLVESTNEYIEKKDLKGMISTALNILLDNKQFYRAAYNVTGQNSFEDMVRNNLRIVMREYFDRNRRPDVLSQYDNNLLSRYYAECLAFNFRYFIFEVGGAKSVEESRNQIVDLLDHPLFSYTGKSTEH
jgi:probable dihydroxyacetone kinase regulator